MTTTSQAGSQAICNLARRRAASCGSSFGRAVGSAGAGRGYLLAEIGWRWRLALPHIAIRAYTWCSFFFLYRERAVADKVPRAHNEPVGRRKSTLISRRRENRPENGTGTMENGLNLVTSMKLPKAVF